MEAFAEIETGAVVARVLKERGLTLTEIEARDALAGEVLMDLRSENGSFEVRESVQGLAQITNEVWKAVDDQVEINGAVAFDFEYAPLVIRTAFIDGLEGSQLREALTVRLTKLVTEEQAKWGQKVGPSASSVQREAALLAALDNAHATAAELEAALSELRLSRAGEP